MLYFVSGHCLIDHGSSLAGLLDFSQHCFSHTLTLTVNFRPKKACLYTLTLTLNLKVSGDKSVLDEMSHSKTYL